ncbi:MAG TPA: hypothetical protein ENI41_02200 [Deltaproteobacteria bacterium]|nr:hypothetical protein [Deltaproteobacteria bacterium]
MRNRVSELQDKLSHAAKQSLDRRFGALYDKIYRSDVLWTAWKQVKEHLQSDRSKVWTKP